MTSHQLYHGTPGFVRPIVTRLIHETSSEEILNEGPNLLMYARNGALVAFHLTNLLRRFDKSCGPMRITSNAHTSSNDIAMAFFMTGDETIDMQLICKDIQTIAATRSVAATSDKQRRVIIIANADIASTMCQLALRKIIETRSVSTLFILTAFAPMGVEAAIISRCTIVNCNAMGSKLSAENEHLRAIALASCRIAVAHLDVASATDAITMLYSSTHKDNALVDTQQCDALIILLAQPKLTDHAFRKAIATFLASPTSLSQHQQHDHRIAKTKSFVQYIVNHKEVPDSVKSSIVQQACIMDMDVCSLTLSARKDARITSTFIHRFFWHVHCEL